VDFGFLPVRVYKMGFSMDVFNLIKRKRKGSQGLFLLIYMVKLNPFS